MPIAFPGHKWNPILTEGNPDTCIHCEVGKLKHTGIDTTGDVHYRVYCCMVCDKLVSMEESR